MRSMGKGNLTSIFSSKKKTVSLLAILVLLLILPFTLLLWHFQRPQQGHATGTTLAIHVVGNNLVDGKGQVIRLIGVNYAAGVGCVRSSPYIFMGSSSTTEIAAMATWHINALRVTLNEDCWLGINKAPVQYAGANYQNAIINVIKLAHDYGMYAIVDLHVNAPGSNLAKVQQPMADADHALAYWTSVANMFKNDPAVILQPYNEPDITTTNAQTNDPWDCWLNGCTITRIQTNRQQYISAQWQSVGMQRLVNTIRATGATNPILIGGLKWANDLTHLLQYLPTDPQHQLIASYHNYKGGITGLNYWNRTIASVAQQMPVITDELGESDCQTAFVSRYMTWADSHNISYLPWGWSKAPCTAYGLLTDWNGTPSAYGQVFFDHFHAINPISAATPPIATFSPKPEIDGIKIL